MFPPHISIGISDSLYESQHVLSNSRFNFQSRDSYLDLLARDAWRSVWWDKYEGYLALKCPTIDRVPRKLDVRVTASWEEPFCILEFKLGNDYCQVSTRPRAGAYGWTKTLPIWKLESDLISTVNHHDSAQSPPAACSNQIPPSESESDSQSNEDDDDIENVPNSRTAVQYQDELDHAPCPNQPGLNPRISIQDFRTEESVQTPRRLSSIGNDSTVASARAWDSPYDYPGEIGFASIGFTPSEVID